MFKITRILLLGTLFSMICGVVSNIVQAGIASPLNQGIGITFVSFFLATKFYFLWLTLLLMTFGVVYYYPKIKQVCLSIRGFFHKKKRKKHFDFIDDNILEIDSYIKDKKEKAKRNGILDDHNHEENQTINF